MTRHSAVHWNSAKRSRPSTKTTTTYWVTRPPTVILYGRAPLHEKPKDVCNIKLESPHSRSHRPVYNKELDNEKDVVVTFIHSRKGTFSSYDRELWPSNLTKIYSRWTSVPNISVWGHFVQKLLSEQIHTHTHTHTHTHIYIRLMALYADHNSGR